MIFSKTAIDGVLIVDVKEIGDERGFFARTYCAEEFAQAEAPFAIVQSNMSFSASKGTLRGFHFQKPPFAEAKFLRCTRGAVLDVAVDIRPNSPTYLKHVAVELSADNRRAMLTPDHCAHAFLTLQDNSEVHYPVSAAYAPDHEGGLRFDDPALGIDWPIDVTNVSDKDRSWPLL